MPDLPQIKMMYRSGIKYKVMVATARIRHARNERNGTVQLNVLQTEHINVIFSDALSSYTFLLPCLFLSYTREKGRLEKSLYKPREKGLPSWGQQKHP